MPAIVDELQPRRRVFATRAREAADVGGSPDPVRPEEVDVDVAEVLRRGPVRGSRWERVDTAGRCLLIDHERSRYAEVPRHHDVEPHTVTDWIPFLHLGHDDSTGELVIHVTPTRLVRLGQ